MSDSIKRLLRVSAIVMLGLCVGTIALHSGLMLKERPQYSAVEGSKPLSPIKVELPQEQLKPIVGPVQNEAKQKQEIPVLVLHAENTLVFNEIVTEKSVAEFLVQAQEMSNRLPEDAEIVVVLYTPGGSISAGMSMIDNLKALPQKVKTLTIFAASMGFQIVQNMDERMIIPSGILMSHRAYGGMEGEIGGEFDVELNAAKRQIQYLDQIAADRMGMTLDAYRTLIRDEYWIHGFEALDDRAADTLTLARCGKDMTGTVEKKFDTMFGAVKVTFSKCPLITGPLDISLDGVAAPDKEQVMQIVEMQYKAPREFVRSYITNRKYEKIFVKK